jgi:glycerol-3-phosphate dehydrogenase
LREADGELREPRARALVNAAGPWVKDVQDELSAEPTRARVRHVKGSHIVVPRVHDEAHAYILQNSDNRIIFVIRTRAISLIGTTDITVEEYEHRNFDEEIGTSEDRQRVLAKPITPRDVVWTLQRCPSVVRRLRRPAVTRDYVLKLVPMTVPRCCRSSAARSRPTGALPSRRSPSSRLSFRK